MLVSCRWALFLARLPLKIPLLYLQLFFLLRTIILCCFVRSSPSCLMAMVCAAADGVAVRCGERGWMLIALSYFALLLVSSRPVPSRSVPSHPVPFRQEGEWGPLFTLLPEFLMSGAVQRAVQSAKDFE